ncbi:MAG: alanine racemase, partial [Candidatus Margulisbacteria bacterium]|nr:alanine racemase [Candidatus Margulisiibacteriota bacterium]
MSIYPQSLSTDTSGSYILSGISLTELAQVHGTPLFVMCDQTIRHQIRRYKHVLDKDYPNYLIAYAGKANLTVGLLNVMSEEGIGVDVVSGGEIHTALKSKMLHEKIVFHGNNKSISELELALSNHIRIVIDNHTEALRIQKLCKEKGYKARVMLRMKPEIEAHTHEYIKTGHIESKFGIRKEEMVLVIKELIKEPNISVLGIHGHIGSQIFDVAPFEDLVNIMVSQYDRI